MKAISLWQPWATLVAIGEKQYETRSWFPKYRGLLAIHAAKKMDNLIKAYCEQEPFKSALGCRDIPLGAIVAVVKLAEVHKTEAIVNSLSKNEQAFGNYQAGRYAWKLEMVACLENPIPMNGSQGLFEVADDLIMRFV